MLQAIVDPTRRTIITLIAFQAMTPNTIADNFNMARQAVSKHLRILTDCDPVKQEHQCRGIYYSLEINKMKEIEKRSNNSKRFGKTISINLTQYYQQLKSRKDEQSII